MLWDFIYPDGVLGTAYEYAYAKKYNDRSYLRRCQIKHRVIQKKAAPGQGKAAAKRPSKIVGSATQNIKGQDDVPHNFKEWTFACIGHVEERLLMIYLILIMLVRSFINNTHYLCATRVRRLYKCNNGGFQDL